MWYPHGWPTSLTPLIGMEIGFFPDPSDSFLDVDTGDTIQLLEDKSQYRESRRGEMKGRDREMRFCEPGGWGEGIGRKGIAASFHDVIPVLVSSLYLLWVWDPATTSSLRLWEMFLGSSHNFPYLWARISNFLLLATKLSGVGLLIL